MDRSARQAPDYETLAELLKAIAYPTRLELLDQLRFPKDLRDVHVRPRRLRPGERAERPAARQTVGKHLEKLTESDLVRLAEPQDGAAGSRYVVNPTKLYALVEELRSILVRHTGRGPGGDDTATVSSSTNVPRQRGPRLILVHGVVEGKCFPLVNEGTEGSGWIIGRTKDLSVSLDYDPFVSHESAVVTVDEGGFSITDLGSKNGTRLNWVLLEPGRTHRLVSGDVIGVGRSLLLFMGE